MSKYITVKLTNGQVQQIIDFFTSENAQLTMLDAERHSEIIAFNQRIISKLAKNRQDQLHS